MNTKLTSKPSIEDGIKPFQPRNLFHLFFQPKTFFSQPAHYHHQSIMVAAYLMGVVSVMDRIDQNLLRADRVTVSGMIETVTQSWLYYWLWVLGMGLLAAVIGWLIQGWWYKKRLQFSGTKDADPQLAIQVLVLQSLVYVLPIIAVTVIQTILYPNYLDAYNYSDVLALMTTPFLFLSCWVSYRGVTQVFEVNGWAKFWFLALPILMYLVVIGVFASLMN